VIRLVGLYGPTRSQPCRVSRRQHAPSRGARAPAGPRPADGRRGAQVGDDRGGPPGTKREAVP
jgi:hypothetical protein